MSERVEIVAWDPAWTGRFAEQRDALRPLLPPTARIEHVGSTAVPGLAAKPIVDMLVGVARLADFERRIPDLEARGWQYVSEHEAEFPQRRFLARPAPQPRSHHLHAVELGTPFWNDHLLFRDHLRGHAADARAYAALKRALAREHADDRCAYTEGKTAFVTDVLARARLAAARAP